MVKWREIEVETEAVMRLAAVGYSPLMARLLAIRGVTPESAPTYFEPSIPALRPPGDLPGVEASAALILEHVRAGREIVVFGDYDCDGICATAILATALRALGARVGTFVPDRKTEGYGMGDASVARMRAEHPEVALVVTVDNGITAVKEVADLRARGVAVVVTDHHLAGETLPEADVLVNPKVEAPDFFSNLSGAGVAFLLARALMERATAEGFYAGPKIGGPLLVMAGLATVTDVMPLSGQNRILVTEAMKAFRTCAPIGLRELYDRASRSCSQTLTARDFGYVIGPRVNAAGRLASGTLALRLMLATDREEARELARQLDLLNMERKGVEQRMLETALARRWRARDGEPWPAQVLDVPDGNEGVSGIVAARVMDATGAENAAMGAPPVPVCIVVNGRGSARAPEGYNIRDALDGCRGFLGEYGGHAAAAGFNVDPGMVEVFRRRFREQCALQTRAAERDEDAAWAPKVDAWVKPADLTLDFVQGLSRMEPYGEGNAEPTFAMKGQFFADIRQIGSDGKHLHLTFRSNAPRAVWWGHGDEIEKWRAASGTAHDLRFAVAISEYGGTHVELRLLEIR